METSRNPRWYREEAKRLREAGERYDADEPLRQSFVELADELDRLAEVLEKGQRTYSA